LLEGTQQVTGKTQMKTQGVPGSQAHALSTQPDHVASHKSQCLILESLFTSKLVRNPPCTVQHALLPLRTQDITTMTTSSSGTACPVTLCRLYPWSFSRLM